MPSNKGEAKKPPWKKRFRRDFDHQFFQVQPRVWTDERVRKLSRGAPNARDLFFFLLFGTERSVIPGVSMCGRAALADALGWETDDIKRCFAELEEKGLAVADWDARLVFLVGAFKQDENCPTSPQQAVRWRREVLDLPDSDLRRRIDEELRDLIRRKAHGLLRFYTASAGPSTRPSDAPAADGKPDGEAYAKRFAKADGKADGEAHKDEDEDEDEDEKNTPIGVVGVRAPHGAQDVDSDLKGAAEGVEQRDAEPHDAIDTPRITSRAGSPHFDFERVYRDHYPLKKGKAKGLDHCKRLIKTPEDFAHFEAGVRAYAAQVRGKEPQFTKHFDSWVNSRRWEDYPATVAGSAPQQPATLQLGPPSAAPSKPSTNFEVMPNGQPWPADLLRSFACYANDAERQEFLDDRRRNESFRFGPDGSAQF